MRPDEHWPRVRALFETAAVMAPAERDAFLQGLGPADAVLRAAVLELLAADARSDDFLQPPLPVDRAPSLVGRRVGAFRVVRAVASGGMGTVWEAEQDEPRRKVAVKTLHPGLVSAQFRRRFRFESELLAGLRHPAIAQVYGAGVLAAEDGGPSLPWFALEFVEDARPLIRYADEQGLDLAARLRLFQTVCSAVQHAHHRGVIHRDLKAANLLVDRDGHVKVIDFGIARLIDGAPMETLAGEIVGTLEAMSPEQVEGRRGDVDARTDVYALGAVLYELTTGRRPYPLEGLSLPEAARCIREHEPVPPSRVVAGLPREIDWIVATAMAKEAARRYAAASDIEREIDRLLAREPVLAGPPSRTYRLRKFCQRNRAGVSLAVLGVLVVGAGLAVYQRARIAEARAHAEAGLTERFSRFVANLFEGLAPEQADGRALTPGSILERGTAWIHADLADRPLVQAGLLCAVSSVHAGLGRYGEAQTVAEAAVALARSQGSQGDAALAQALARLGKAQRQLHATAAAERTLNEAIAIQRRLGGPEDAKLAPQLHELGLLLALSRPQEALALYREAYELEVRQYGESSGDAAIILGNIGNLELRARRYEAAKDILERVLPLLVARHGETDPRVGGLLGNLALAHLNLGNYERALELELRDLALAERTITLDHPQVGVVYFNLARITESLGDAGRALEYAEQGAATCGRHFPATHPTRLTIENLRARLMLRAGRRDEARAILRELESLVPANDEAGFARLRGALVFAELERIEQDLARSLGLADRVLADPLTARDARLTADAHWARAYALARRGDEAEADLARERALATLPAEAAPGVPQVYATAKFAVLRGDLDHAIELFTQAIAAGYRNATLLADPDFDELRKRPEFTPIAAALTRRRGE